MPEGRRYFLSLAAILVLEVAVFSVTSTNFLTPANGFEILRLSVELGLLALALTLVIITGGIDLSVGSMMGLAAVVFGGLWRDHSAPLAIAAGAALMVGALGGGLNAWLITRFHIPPLIVTLGSYSLFRGIAEGVTAGAETYTGFPKGFLALGQGPQIVVFAVAAVFFGVVLHRTVVGRSLVAIGFSEAAARYGAIRVKRTIAIAYVLSGLTAALAALIYAAHIGQAKSDAGTGYELMAITAVVLGGTSIFGGRGSIVGTLAGLAVIAVLQNGLRLSNAPAEWSGILTGILLLASIGISRAYEKLSRGTLAATSQEFEMKNSHVAMICATILLAALMVVGSNWWMVQQLRPASAGTLPAHRTTIGMMPKAKGDPYFVSCRKGAEEAAREVNAELLWDGSTDVDPAKQNEVVEGWITRGVDAVAVSVGNQAAISTVLRKARERGMKVVTWDSDAQPDARDFFVNQATPQGIGNAIADETARLLGGKGEFAIITGALSATNQNEWIEFIKKRIAEKYPQVKLAVIRPSDDDRDRAFAEAQTILKVYPQVKVLAAIAAPAVPGAAEAVKQSGRKDVQVTGLSLPNLCKPYIHDGAAASIVLWNTADLGYLTVIASDALVKGTLKPGATHLTAGRLGSIEVRGTQVILGAPFLFNRANIDGFDF